MFFLSLFYILSLKDVYVKVTVPLLVIIHDNSRERKKMLNQNEVGAEFLRVFRDYSQLERRQVILKSGLYVITLLLDSWFYYFSLIMQIVRRQVLLIG